MHQTKRKWCHGKEAWCHRHNIAQPRDQNKAYQLQTVLTNIEDEEKGWEAVPYGHRSCDWIDDKYLISSDYSGGKKVRFVLVEIFNRDG